MEFGDLLYVLIMVAVAVFSIVKKSRGRKEHDVLTPEFEADASPEEVFPPGTFWEGKVKPLIRPPDNKEKKVHRSGFKRIDFNKKRIKNRTITSGLKKRQAPKILLEEDEQVNFSYWDEEPIDLRKAVIYNEILKRPDY